MAKRATRAKGRRRSETSKSGMPRRSFLNTGLIGAAAATLGAPRLAAQGTVTEGSACKARPPTPAPQECVIRDLQGAQETWNEPWVWRPSDWPGQQLDLNVVLNQNPGEEVGLGNPGSVFFSYGGNTPGPTVRMRGDETLAVKLRNLLGEDRGESFVGPFPDLGDLPRSSKEDLKKRQKEVIDKATARNQHRFDFCLGEHTNGLHSAHVTNLHTHGLHVRPDKNPDGTHSDNVILRVLSQGDFKRRERAILERERQNRCPDGECGSDITPPLPVEEGQSACQFLRDPEQIYFVRDDEVVGEANYEFRLGDVQGDPNQPHPPGTHWYHPHAHGATDIQVSSGMAGFLIVEGDVDDRINCAMTGIENPDPSMKTGPWDYRERLMFMQRVFPGNIVGDPDSPKTQLKKRPVALLNGSENPGIINMRPGAIERWRVINGSVDGRGYKRFMVVKGQFQTITEGFDECAGDLPEVSLKKIVAGKAESVDLADLEAAKQHLRQLAIDGITLVEVRDGKARYFIKDLAAQYFDGDSCTPPSGPPPDGVYPPNPLATPCTPPRLKDGRILPNAEKLCRIESVFRNAASIRNTWVRPNEFYMGPANRTDLFFQCPTDAKCGDVFTVLAKAAVVHADTPVFNLQRRIDSETPAFGPVDIIVAHIVVVDETPVPGLKEGPADKVASLTDCLPEVPPYLEPIPDSELMDGNGQFRTRILNYSGWGNDGLPLVTTAEGDPSAANFRNFVDSEEGQALQDLRWTDWDGTQVLLAPAIRTMAINNRKFNPTDPLRPQVLVDTAEEWVLYNTSQMLWGYTDPSSNPQQGQYRFHYRSFPITRAQGEEEFWKGQDPYVPWDECTNQGGPDFRVVTRGIDHPFHIHQNPFWVLRIEIPDENGNLVNILQQPRWMDSLWIPRHGGRVIFRSRFPDYVGAYVNHCHILQHEDNGMMQTVQATPFPEEANYTGRDRVSDGTNPCNQPVEQVNGLYPPPTRDQMYVMNFNFVDPNLPHGAESFEVERTVPPDTGQVYPGFEVVPPKFES